MANTERVRLLVEALRSGQYTQARHALAKNGGFCCLGVACEVAKANGLPVSTDVIVDEGDQLTLYDGAELILPPSVIKWFGFGALEAFRPGDNPTILDANGMAFAAASVNDSGWTFGEIADGFERTYLEEAAA